SQRKHWRSLPPTTWCDTASCRVDLYRYAFGGDHIEAAVIVLERCCLAGEVLPAFRDDIAECLQTARDQKPCGRSFRPQSTSLSENSSLHSVMNSPPQPPTVS